MNAKRMAKLGMLGMVTIGSWSGLATAQTPPTRPVMPAGPIQEAGAPVLPPNARLMAKRAAELDAYRKMTERIYGLRIAADTTVRDFVTTHDRVGGTLDNFIRGVRLVNYRYLDDGTVEVDAECTLEQVITMLRRSCEQFYHDDRWTRDSFEEMWRYAERNVLRVTGTGAVDAILPADAPPPPEAGPVAASPRIQPSNVPGIFRHYPPAAKLMARRAAEMDAYRLLYEQVCGLHIASDTTVGNFVTRDDRIGASLRGYLKGARIEEVRYLDDGTVEVRMALTLEEVITAIKRSCDDVYRNGRWSKENSEDVRRWTERRVIRAVGTGALDTERYDAPRSARWERLSDDALSCGRAGWGYSSGNEYGSYERRGGYESPWRYDREISRSTRIVVE